MLFKILSEFGSKLPGNKNEDCSGNHSAKIIVDLTPNKKVMWQRIQTVYLLLCAILFSLLAGLKIPMGKLAHEDSNVAAAAAQTSFDDGRFTPEDHILLVLLILLIAFISIVIIFLFKKRKLQANLTRVMIFLMLICGILAFYLMYNDLNTIRQLADTTFTPALGAFIPLAGILLAYLAQKAIQKDEEIVRSMDRLR
jgi:hypothetical protein